MQLLQLLDTLFNRSCCLHCETQNFKWINLQIPSRDSSTVRDVTFYNTKRDVFLPAALPFPITVSTLLRYSHDIGATGTIHQEITLAE